MSADVLREAARLMRERAEGADVADDCMWRDDVTALLEVSDGTFSHAASWHPAVTLAVAKAMDDVAHAWEIADEVADGYVYDADDNHYRFKETVDGGWLEVARAYLGGDSR